METVIDPIRAAIASDATPETKAAGVAACRAILNALESAPGEPLGAAQFALSNAPHIASIVGALRGVPPDQLLDLAITKLRAALPAGTVVPQAQPLKFHLVPVANPGGKAR